MKQSLFLLKIVTHSKFYRIILNSFYNMTILSIVLSHCTQPLLAYLVSWNFIEAMEPNCTTSAEYFSLITMGKIVLSYLTWYTIVLHSIENIFIFACVMIHVTTNDHKFLFYHYLSLFFFSLSLLFFRLRLTYSFFC